MFMQYARFLKYLCQETTRDAVQESFLLAFPWTAAET